MVYTSALSVDLRNVSTLPLITELYKLCTLSQGPRSYFESGGGGGG